MNLSKLFLPKIHRPFGKALRFFACGGAKLNEEAARFLMKIGFTILEGYGLTVVERVSLEMLPTKDNITYLKTKQEKLGHILNNI